MQKKYVEVVDLNDLECFVTLMENLGKKQEWRKPCEIEWNVNVNVDLTFLLCIGGEMLLP